MERRENAENGRELGNGKRQRRLTQSRKGAKNAKNGDRLGNSKQRTARGPHAKPQGRQERREPG